MISNTTLCYPECDGMLLMLHRTKKENDINRDKWIGIGGHLEEGESPDDCMRREMLEETGMTAGSMQLRGIVTFVCGDTTEIMFLYSAYGLKDRDGRDVTPAQSLPACDEGELAWVDWERIAGLPLWEGDRLFLDRLRSGDPFFTLKLVYSESGRLLEAV